MSNHLHLLVTPEAADSVPLMMQGVGRAYVRYFNRRHGRSGTLWEGRYRSTLIEAERHLLACMVYLDLNPVRAGMLASAADYPWSSHAHLAGLRHDPLLTPHPLYWQLGNTPFAREQAYVDLVRAGLAPEQHADGIASALTGLDERSRRIVEERWLNVNDDGSGGMTLHELAAEYGVSAERIRQIEVAAMKKTKKTLAEFA